MDIGHALTFAFEDPESTDRIGIGTLIAMVPILNFAATGYQVEISRRVMRDEDRLLPRWDDLGRKWVEGTVLIFALLIYQLPFLLLACGPLALFVPVLFISNEQQANSAANMVLLFWSLTCCVGLFLSLIVSFLAPAIRLQYVRRGAFAACFNFPAILDTIRQNTGRYLVAWLGVLCANLVYNIVAFAGVLVSMIVPFVGWIVQVLVIGAGFFWVETVTGHLVGQLGMPEQSDSADPKSCLYTDPLSDL